MEFEDIFTEAALSKLDLYNFGDEVEEEPIIATTRTENGYSVVTQVVKFYKTEGGIYSGRTDTHYFVDLDRPYGEEEQTYKEKAKKVLEAEHTKTRTLYFWFSFPDNDIRFWNIKGKELKVAPSSFKNFIYTKGMLDEFEQTSEVKKLKFWYDFYRNFNETSTIAKSLSKAIKNNGELAYSLLSDDNGDVHSSVSARKLSFKMGHDDKGLLEVQSEKQLRKALGVGKAQLRALKESLQNDNWGYGKTLFNHDELVDYYEATVEFDLLKEEAQLDTLTRLSYSTFKLVNNIVNRFGNTEATPTTPITRRKVMRYVYIDTQEHQGYSSVVRAANELEDYLNMASQYDNFVPFPKYLRVAHDILSKNMSVGDGVDLYDFYMSTENMKHLEGVYDIDGEKLVFMLLQTPEELINEGQSQSNCVGGYARKVVRGNDYIFSVRKYDEPHKSYITLETSGEELLQEFLTFNQTVPNEVQRLIQAWGKKVGLKPSKQGVGVREQPDETIPVKTYETLASKEIVSSLHDMEKINNIIHSRDNDKVEKVNKAIQNIHQGILYSIQDRRII